MSEEVTLAGRLRALACEWRSEDFLSARGAAEELEELAQEWERLEGVRREIRNVLQAVRTWTQVGTDLGLRPGEGAIVEAQEALELEVEEVLEYVRQCLQCDVARHLCPGCGADVPHGQVACTKCSAPDWRPGTWGEVISGDRVRLGTAEAVVEFVVPMTVAPSGLQQASVKLAHREKAYIMDPRGPVEILRGAPGQAVDESGVTVLASWGQDFVDAVGILRDAFPGLEAVNDG